MIDTYILKEHIERIKPGQRIELKNTYGETTLDITKTKFGVMVGFNEAGLSFNGLINIIDPLIKVYSGNLEILSADTESGKWNASLTIYPEHFVSMEVLE